MSEHVVSFSPAGTAQTTHTDEVNLAHLGPQQIERTVDIIFDKHTQTWTLWLVGCRTPDERVRVAIVGGFHSYNAARQVEVDWLAECRKNGISPASGDALKIARTLTRDYLKERGPDAYRLLELAAALYRNSEAS